MTVQPLWDLYAAHFERPDADPAGPPPSRWQQLWRASASIACRWRPSGSTSCPVRGDTERHRAGLHHRPRGCAASRPRHCPRAGRYGGDARDRRSSGWRTLVGGVRRPVQPGNVAEWIPIADRAVATSGGYGTEFDAAGRFNHIFDPGDGSTSHTFAAVSVIAPDATMANSLSTAFSVMTFCRASQRSCTHSALRRTWCPRDGPRTSIA